MDPKSIALFLSMQGYNDKLIHEELVKPLGAYAVGYSMVTRCVRSSGFRPPPAPTPAEPRGQPLIAAILMVLADEPFALVRRLTRATHLSPTIVYRRVTGTLGFTVRHIRGGLIPSPAPIARPRTSSSKTEARGVLIPPTLAISYRVISAYSATSSTDCTDNHSMRLMEF
jgi:hypothetical protein